jgi:hypothetical protein
MIKQPPRTRSIARRVLVLAGVLIAVAAVPASASAAVRTLSIEDPQGDASALSGPVLDLKSMAIRYDDAAGTLGVTWTYYGDVRSAMDQGGSTGGRFDAVRPLGPNVANDSVSGYWSVSSGGASASLSLFGSTGSLTGTAAISPDGRVVTAAFSHAMLIGHDWRFSWGGGVTNGDAFGDEFHKFWFEGYSEPNTPTYLPPPGSTPPGSTPPGNSGVANANQGMTINGGALYTNDPQVTLSVTAPSWANALRVSNDGGFGGARAFAVNNTIRWRLAESGPERLPKTVYLRFGNDVQNFTDDIILDQTKPAVTAATVAGAGAATASVDSVQAAASKSRTYRVRLRAKDATSGVAKVQFAQSKRRPMAPRKFQRVSRVQGSDAPKYVRVQDGAGNFSSWRSIR